MFGVFKKIFIGLLAGLVNGSNNTRCVSLNNQKCMTQPTLINFHPIMNTFKNFATMHLQLN